MGYTNPARNCPGGFRLSIIGSGFGSFRGLVDGKSPLKMISYGVVDQSNLARAREVNSTTSSNVLQVKSINIFPLPGEWERTVGFMGTCADAAILHFTPFQGALSFATRMVPTGMISFALLFI